MPFVRCRFYTENGEPLRGGCRRKGVGCAFVHPGDSDWINAPPPRAKDKSGDLGNSKPWGERGKRGAVAPSEWGTGGDANTSATDSWNGWGTGGGWGTEGGWDMGGSASTPDRVPEPAQPKNPSTTKSRDASALVSEWSQVGTTPSASGNTKNSEDGWRGSADRATGSAWGSSENAGWGTSSWGESKDADKDAGSAWGNAPNDGQGAGWGDDESAGPTWASAGSGWGAGWGDNKGATNSWGASDPMVVDNQAEKKTEQSKGKGKVVLPPPRIRIPDNGSKKAKFSGTNNEPLGTSKWGEPRSCNILTASTPVTASTPLATLTPTDSSRVKRKRDVAFDDKLDIFKEYVKSWERGVRARFLLAEAEAKRDRWFRTQKSACYARIGEAGRKRLDGQRAECDKEVNSQREKLSGAIKSLVDFYDANSSNLDLGQHYNIGEEAKKFIEESKVFVDEVRALLVEHILRDKNTVQSGDNQKSPSETDTTPIGSLRCRVRDLEERFEQARTELTLRHQSDIHSEIDGLLTRKIADLRVARQCEIDRIASHPRPKIVIPPSAVIEGTVQQVKELDAKVPHTVENIRVLLLQVDATTKRVSKLEEELAISKDMYKKRMQEMATEKVEFECKVDERLEKIREQCKHVVASQLPGPPTQLATSPTTRHSQDKLIESLQPAFEAMLDKFYEREVQPTIISLQQDVIKASDHHQEEAIKVLWGKIQPAMNMVAGVSQWLDSQELRITAPIDDM